MKLREYEARKPEKSTTTVKDFGRGLLGETERNLPKAPKAEDWSAQATNAKYITVNGQTAVFVW